MSSAAAKGSYYKARTKKHYEALGYAVGHLERMMWIRGGGLPCPTCRQARMFAQKQDQFGADLLAVREDQPVTFIQVKLGRTQLAKAAREFAQFPFPATARRVIVVWEKGARAPDVIDAEAYLETLR